MEVPSNLQIIVTHSPGLLKKDIKKKIHVWYVKHDKWIELDVPVVGDDVSADEARYKLTTHIRNLKYPTIVSMTKL